jgi:hypothetical protein
VKIKEEEVSGKVKFKKPSFMRRWWWQGRGRRSATEALPRQEFAGNSVLVLSRGDWKIVAGVLVQIDFPSRSVSGGSIARSPDCILLASYFRSSRVCTHQMVCVQIKIIRKVWSVLVGTREEGKLSFACLR